MFINISFKIETYINILYINNNMVKIPIYIKIDESVKERSTMYLAKCKLLKKNTKTMALLIEEALDSYMIKKPL